MIPIDIRDIRAHSAALQAQRRQHMTEGELRKELAIARGNLARMKVQGDINALRSWSVRAVQTAEAGARIGALTLSIVAAVNLWRHRRQAPVTTASRWVKALGLVGSVLWRLRSSVGPGIGGPRKAGAPAVPAAPDVFIASRSRR